MCCFMENDFHRYGDAKIMRKCKKNVMESDFDFRYSFRGCYRFLFYYKAKLFLRFLLEEF